MSSEPSKNIEVFPNPYPERNYVVHCECPEFTCLCPRTGQPDFATIHIRYVPAKMCFELKALKNYLWSFRNEGAFHEKVANQILNDLVYVVEPSWMEIQAVFSVRGGITTTVTATHGEKSRDIER
ncbi:MAG: NADPH-dependent 7-cyano-7-deazaguanine reductase QueF [Deltaproteobacteria bacterium RIFCSPLOWO2_01_44_7]|nr:MAG: NADPH-dependent 7-cyano-7-deazaguanine reductase QueF [Deltaproteobacteria bacterium RIFCSPHIGHO2_01_FULL_43_49]OGQ15114.1 MAG: NADPH-dependent 7-cyano-7-deazaguanine reductase QueF [Deltaproteobacteria bacterium RIFCSPHIGHO2_02_FULL_44_53]OGQ27265.1 MAG: NADPH-dependent 7-cyano-7-deazaguanine reductase QueF [Deltaproteobacteria bacterium RIFCSPHIGHO2_12_FULL_44_21]OGQ31631.1 MAG: NADPH-dependent 7-cyano-7-deazaguanine reductase QueF [Deltaproteobacteria bacterium RIFCSPLOWO2_01_FULL_45_